MENESHLPSTGPSPLSPSLPSKGSPRAKKPGGWRAIKYILGNESFEKLASMSLISNITVYLRTRYNMSGIFLVNVVTIWSGSSNVASIGGAIVSDIFLGRFLTLLFGTLCSLMGMTTVTLTAAIPDLRPPRCQEDNDSACISPQKWQLAFLFTGLGLIAIGAGGIRPCNIAFGADQFDTRTEKGRAQLESFFNWWYFSFTIALVIALTAVVYIQTNISWVVGFAIPAACLAGSIVIFLLGIHTYICKKPQGSAFGDMAKVISAAFHKRNVNLKSGQYPVYDPKNDVEENLESQICKNQVIKHRFKCLDKAAIIVDPSELNPQGKPVNTWRLSSVEQVEQLKCLIGIVPVWISGIGCFVVMDQQSTFGILQAIQMNRSIRNFHVPPGWMGISSMIALSIWIFLYERVYIPTAKRILKRDSRLNMKHRIRAGMVTSILCMFIAGIVENKRRHSALEHGSFVSPLHVAALLPQFVFSGLTEAFAAVALMEFFTTTMPETMRSVAGAIFFLSLSVASYLSSLMTNIIHAATGGNGKKPWLGGHDLNRNRLEYYYYLIGALGVVNLIYFTFVASRYVHSGTALSTAESPQLIRENSTVPRARRDYTSLEIKEGSGQDMTG